MSGSSISPRAGRLSRDDEGHVFDADLRARSVMVAGDDGDPTVFEAFFALMSCARELNEALQVVAGESGLSLSRAVVLSKLWRTPGGAAPMHELATWCNVSARNVTGLVDGLERDALVERVADPGDRRVTSVRITSEGRAAAGAYRPGHLRVLDDVFSALSPDARGAFIEACVALAHRAVALNPAD